MKKKVLIAMSGGVDSSAAALLLQKQGYECAGATLSLCGNETDGAKRIADGLGMPFYIFDEHELFAREVMDRQRVPRGPHAESVHRLQPLPQIRCIFGPRAGDGI